jgi:hypothetical protein
MIADRLARRDDPAPLNAAVRRTEYVFPAIEPIALKSYNGCIVERASLFPSRP